LCTREKVSGTIEYVARRFPGKGIFSPPLTKGNDMKTNKLFALLAVSAIAAALSINPAFAGDAKVNPCAPKVANPCASNPCAAKANPCAPMNEMHKKKEMAASNPCAMKNPCAAKANPCAPIKEMHKKKEMAASNPCAMKNPCAAKANPCAPMKEMHKKKEMAASNPCAMKNPCAAKK
jgi:hypothetical protein